MALTTPTRPRLLSPTVPPPPAASEKRGLCGEPGGIERIKEISSTQPRLSLLHPTNLQSADLSHLAHRLINRPTRLVHHLLASLVDSQTLSLRLHPTNSQPADQVHRLINRPTSPVRHLLASPVDRQPQALCLHPINSRSAGQVHRLINRPTSPVRRPQASPLDQQQPRLLHLVNSRSAELSHLAHRLINRPTSLVQHLPASPVDKQPQALLLHPIYSQPADLVHRPTSLVHHLPASPLGSQLQLLPHLLHLSLLQLRALTQSRLPTVELP
jgi:hypothetical protein